MDRQIRSQVSTMPPDSEHGLYPAGGQEPLSIVRSHRALPRVAGNSHRLPSSTCFCQHKQRDHDSGDMIGRFLLSSLIPEAHWGLAARSGWHRRWPEPCAECERGKAAPRILSTLEGDTTGTHGDKSPHLRKGELYIPPRYGSKYRFWIVPEGKALRAPVPSPSRSQAWIPGQCSSLQLCQAVLG